MDEVLKLALVKDPFKKPIKPKKAAKKKPIKKATTRKKKQPNTLKGLHRPFFTTANRGDRHTSTMKYT